MLLAAGLFLDLAAATGEGWEGEERGRKGRGKEKEKREGQYKGDLPLLTKGG